MSEHVIELDGKRYDAITGAYLGKSHVIPKHITDRYVHGKVIDGFVRSQPAKKPSAAKQQTTRSAEAPKAKVMTTTEKVSQVKARITVRATPNQAHSQANHLQAHNPQHSKTLVRHHVRKPQFTMKTAITKAHAPAEVMAKPNSALMQKRSAYSVDRDRQQRAVATRKHHAIRHFTAPAIHSVSAQVAVIPVEPVPLQLKAPATPVAPPTPIMHHNDIFESAMARATSHEQPVHKVRRRSSGKRRLLNSLAVMGTFLVIGGFVTYLNLPGIQMRIASMQAGFGASLPTYAPTGYALQGSVKRSGDVISVSFRSGASQYRITQQSSNWDSQTLLDDTLALGGEYQAVQKNGQTIYIYKDEGANASWVNGGVRYDLTGNAELSQNEIISIATSL